MTTKTKLNEAAATLAANVRKCQDCAFNASEARARLVATICDSCGLKPSLVTFDAIRHAVICGIMASALARKGDNRKQEAIIAHCDERLTKYQGYGGLAPVRDGMKGRRTEEEEKAYTSARVQWHGLIKDAGVTVPDGKSGGANNAKGAPTKNAGKAGGATTPKVEPEVAKANGKVSDVVPTPKFANEKQAVAWAKREAAAMLATINGSAGKVPSWLKSAVADFHAAVKKQTAAETPVVTAPAK